MRRSKTMKERLGIISGQCFQQILVSTSTSDGASISSGNLRRGKRKLASVVSINRTLVVFVVPIVVIIFALTGFVCTYKIQAEEECLSSKTLCYECDSRYDPNCADPFDLSSLSLTEQQSLAAKANKSSIQNNSNKGNNNVNTGGNGNDHDRQQQSAGNLLDGTDSQWAGNPNMTVFRPKKMPNVVNCHGCCVKITSKTTDGATYVKRTCTTNLQINYFMVGLVCMKESGDRGKMCFCETDYCNGQVSNRPPAFSVIGGLLAMVAILMVTKLSSTLIWQASIQEHMSTAENDSDNPRPDTGDDSRRDRHRTHILGDMNK